MNKISNILEAIGQGDKLAFTQFYELYETRLLRHIRSFVINDEVANEVMHEVCMKIIKKSNKADFKKGESYSNSWIYKIATNSSLDYLRKIKLNATHDESAKTLQGIDTSFELSDILIDLFPLLPVKQRTFMNLKVNDGLSYKEIAKSCSCSENLVKQGIFQARKFLKIKLLSLGYEI